MKTLRPRDGVIAFHLAHLPLFADLPQADLDALAVDSLLRLYDRGEVLFEAGDPPTLLHAVVDGSVRIVRADPSGREKVLHLATAPATFAELPAMMGRPYPARAICNEPCTIAAVPRSALTALAVRDPQFPLRMLGAAMSRLHHLTEALARHGQKSAVVRVAAYLRGLAEGSDAVALPGAKKDVANYLGLQPESFSRALAALRQCGAIEVEDHTVRILDQAALEAAIHDE